MIMEADLERLNSVLKQHLAGLDDTQTQATPDVRGKWSIQQIVEHLLLTYRATIAVMQTRVDKRTPTQAKPTAAQRLGQWMVIGVGRFPFGRPSPEAVCPSPQPAACTGEELAHRVQTELLRLDALAVEAEALFGTRRSISHMLLGPLSVPQWRRFHLVHGQHHAKQIRAIRSQRSL